MGKGKRRKSNKVKAKAKPRSKQLSARPTSVNDLPDELLDVVLLNLGSPLHLIRAAATCRRWRRAIADAGFVARSRALHGAPPVAGRYYVTDRLPPAGEETDSLRALIAGRRRSGPLLPRLPIRSASRR